MYTKYLNFNDDILKMKKYFVTKISILTLQYLCNLYIFFSLKKYTIKELQGKKSDLFCQITRIGNHLTLPGKTDKMTFDSLPLSCKQYVF